MLESLPRPALTFLQSGQGFRPHTQIYLSAPFFRGLLRGEHARFPPLVTILVVDFLFLIGAKTPQFKDGPTYIKFPSRLPSRVKIETVE